MNRYILFCLIISSIIVLYPLQAYSTSPTRPAELLFTSGQLVSSQRAVKSLLEDNKQAIIKLFADYELKITTEPIDINNREFLFAKATVTVKKVRKGEKGVVVSKTYIPAKGRIFKVSVPVVEKGSSYKEEDGKIILRINKHLKEHFSMRDSEGRIVEECKFYEYIPVYARVIYFFVDEAGNVYY